MLLFPAHRKSPIRLRMVHLHLTLANSKGQSQCHTNFDCEYLINEYRQDICCYCQYKGSRLLAFDWHIYIWPWPILKVKVNRNSISKIRKLSQRCISPYVSVYVKIWSFHSRLLFRQNWTLFWYIRRQETPIMYIVMLEPLNVISTTAKASFHGFFQCNLRSSRSSCFVWSNYIFTVIKMYAGRTLRSSQDKRSLMTDLRALAHPVTITFMKVCSTNSIDVVR